MLFINKYHPKIFDEISFNRRSADQIKLFSRSDNVPHMILNGPSGCGKKTFADLYVKYKVGSEFKMKEQNIQIKHSNKNLSIKFYESKYHIVINPSSYGVYDKIILQKFIKEIVQTKTINNLPYHIIIIDDAHKLNMDAQQALRRTLEKYVKNCRFIFIVDNNSTIISPLHSRCVLFRLSSPTVLELRKILNRVIEKEDIEICCDVVDQIIDYSDRNVKTALNLLQLLSVKYKDQLMKQKIDIKQFIDYEKYILFIVNKILKTKNIDDIKIIRSKMYDMLIHTIDPICIMKSIYWRLIEIVPNKYVEFTEILVKYENTLKYGGKPSYHLEGFIISLIHFFLKSCHEQSSSG